MMQLQPQRSSAAVPGAAKSDVPIPRPIVRQGPLDREIKADRGKTRWAKEHADRYRVGTLEALRREWGYIRWPVRD